VIPARTAIFSAGMVLLAILAFSADVSPDIDLENARRIKTYPSGAKEYLLTDGSRAVVWPNGNTRRTLRDGTVIHTWPPAGNNEILRIKKPDGTVESKFADGTEKNMRPNGSVSWRFSDGRLREEKRDGSVWENSVTDRDLVDPEVVKMSPWPRRVKPGDRVVFSGELLEGYHNPWACVLLSGGELREFKTESFIIRGNRFSLPVTMNDGPGLYKIEIIVRGPLGNRIALNVGIWVNIEPPDEGEKPTLYRTVDPGEPLHHLEAKFYKMINRERGKRDIKTVIWDIEAGQLSRHMAREMASEGFFGHISPKWGNIAKRAVRLYKWNSAAHGLPTSPPDESAPNFIADCIVKSRSFGGAMVTLLESPAHRRIILSPYCTHTGVGVSRVKNGDGRDVIIVIAMLQLNRPRHSISSKPKKIEEEKPFRIYGRP